MVAAHYPFSVQEHERYPQHLFSNGALMVGWLVLLLAQPSRHPVR